MRMAFGVHCIRIFCKFLTIMHVTVRWCFTKSQNHLNKCQCMALCAPVKKYIITTGIH